MEPDNRLLLPLLAVRMLGGRSVPEDTPGLREVKKILAEAVVNGWVQKETVKIPDLSKPGKKGKPATKNQKVVHLTEEGERVLREAADPQALAVTSAGVLAGLRQSLEADRQVLRAQVEAALAPKEEGKLTQELGKLAKAVEGLVAKFEKLESLTSGHETANGLLGQIERSFAAMGARLENALSALPAEAPTGPPASGHAPPRTNATSTTTPATTPGEDAVAWMDDVVAMATKQKRENPMQRLSFSQIYSSLKHRYPALSLSRFHEGLRMLSDQQRVRLRPYTLALETIEDPRNALYLDREVKYYVDVP